MKVVQNTMLKNNIYFYILAVIILIFLYLHVNKEAAAVFILTGLVMMYHCKCTMSILLVSSIITALYILIFAWNKRIIEGADTMKSSEKKEKEKNKKS